MVIRRKLQTAYGLVASPKSRNRIGFDRLIGVRDSSLTMLGFHRVMQTVEYGLELSLELIYRFVSIAGRACGEVG
jgi:hypothetical protein